MDVEVVKMEPMLIVGWRIKFISLMSPDANSSDAIGNLWAKTFRHDLLSKLPGSLGHPTWGVIWEDPESERSHPHELNYLAAVPFSSLPELPEGLTSRQPPAMAYAKATHKGPLEGLKDTVLKLHKWAETEGYTAPENWSDLELYDERIFKEGPEQAFDNFISICPKA